MFRTVPLSIARSLTPYTQQWYMSYKFCWLLANGIRTELSSVPILLASCQQTGMTYIITVCTVKNSWRCTELLSETCSVLSQKYIWEIRASRWFYYKNISGASTKPGQNGLKLMHIGPCIIVIVEKETNLMSLFIKFYFTSSMLNIFRTLIHPSSGAYDFSIVLPHWSCVLVSMCVGVSVWLGWGVIRVAGFRLKPATWIPL